MIRFLIDVWSEERLGFLQCACAEQLRKPINVWIPQILKSKFVGFGDTILIENVVSLLSERSD